MGFRESFTRDQGGENNLQYDDSAFYYFFLTILCVFMLPLFISILRPLLSPLKFNPKRICPCASCQSKKADLKKKSQYKWLTKWWLIKIIILVGLALLAKDVYFRCVGSNTIKSFDPFEILEIERGSSEQEIRKAYRKLTVKYHPDKNQNDPQATAKFILITKAYECLTDEKSKSNCEKFGNPDGPGSFNVAIALPSFLLKKENNVAVLSVFFIILLIIIPGAVFWWYSENSQYDEKGVPIVNKQRWYPFLNENLIVKSCPEIMAFSQDFSTDLMPCRSSQENDELNKLLKSEIFSAVPKPKVDKKHYKALLVILAYMQGAPVPEVLKKDLSTIQQKFPKLIRSLVDLAAKVPQRNSKNPNKIKMMGSRCVLHIIEFGQLFFQGMWVGESPLLQIKQFDRDLVAKLNKKSKKPINFREVVASADDQKIGIGGIPEEMRESVKQELSYFPNVDVEHEMFDNDGGNEILVGDFFSLKVKIIRKNLKEKEEARYVHSNAFESLISERWYILLEDATTSQLMDIALVKSSKRVIEKEFRFRLFQPKEYEMTVHVLPEAYKGLDFEFPIKFKVSSDDITKRKVEIHPEDAALDKEKSLMAQLMEGMNPKQENSDEEYEEEDENPKNKKGQKKKGDNDEKKAEKENGIEEHAEEEEEEEEADEKGDSDKKKK